MAQQTDIRIRTNSFVGWLLLTACVAMLLVSHASADDKTLRNDFAKQYNPHATNLQYFYTNFEAKFVNTYHYPNGKKDVSFSDGKCSGENWLLGNLGRTAADEKPELSSTRGKTIEGGNSRYEFTLTKRESNLYVVNSATVHQDGKLAPLCFLLAPVAGCLYGKQTFSKMTSDKSIQFLEFEDCIWQDKPAKKLKLQLINHYGNALQNTADIIVTYFFSPQDGWVCRGLQAHQSSKTDKIREDIYFYEQREGYRFPVLKQLETRTKYPKNPEKTRLVSSTDITEFTPHKPFPESDFTLSAFGLPEPYGVVWKTGPPWYLWCILGAVVFLGLGWYFRRRVRRGDVRVLGASPT